MNSGPRACSRLVFLSPVITLSVIMRRAVGLSADWVAQQLDSSKADTFKGVLNGTVAIDHYISGSACRGPWEETAHFLA